MAKNNCAKIGRAFMLFKSGLKPIVERDVALEIHEQKMEVMRLKLAE